MCRFTQYTSVDLSIVHKRRHQAIVDTTICLIQFNIPACKWLIFWFQRFSAISLIDSDVILEIVNGISTDIEVTRHGVNAFFVCFIASVINIAPNSGKWQSFWAYNHR